MRASLSWLLPLASVAIAASQQIPLTSALTGTLPSSAFKPTSISRTVELGGALTKTSTTYNLEKASGVSGQEWIVGVSGQEGYIEAWGSDGGSRKELPLTRLGRTGEDITFYSITPPTTDSPIISLMSVLSHQSTPVPASLPQLAESIGLLWTDDLLAPVAYLNPADRALVTELKVRVKTPTPKIIAIQNPNGFEQVYSKGAAGVTFIAKDLSGLGPQLASVHYQNPEAVASFRTLDRLLEVSHWGSNLAVQDSIDLVNSGPKLLGHFARIDHQKLTMQRRSTALSITALSFTLPPRISSPYYYDIVGNVSTSNFRASGPPAFQLPSQKRKAKKNNEFSQLDIRPRYPLMGGWNYTFTMGYDAPLDDYLKKNGDKWLLAVPFLTPVKDVAVDDVSIEIRLPEAARNIKVHLPFAVDSLTYPTEAPSFFRTTPGYHKTFLDSTGRPTIKITKKNCGDRHGSAILIEYTTSPLLDLFQKPFAVAAVVTSLFLVVMGIRRIDFTIGK
ncbi:Oligosaccharyl transferase alpha subunit [Meredithblackwellia eburnea MCA 4105]